MVMVTPVRTPQRSAAMPRARTSYGPGGVESVFDLGPGVDIGAKPDFWADMDQVMRRLKPTKVGGEAGAVSQGRALRSAPAAREFVSQGERSPREPQRYDPFSGMVITGRSFARPSMSPQGVLGHYVNPLDVPVQYQGAIPTGFFTDSALSNYTYSPTVNPARYATGQFQREKPR